MKWLLSFIAGLIALVLIALVLLVGVVSVPAGAGWVTERALRWTIDSRIEVRGHTEIDLWPILIVRTQGLVIPATPGRSAGSGCGATTAVQLYPLADVKSATLLLDWQQLFARHIYVPAVQIDDLVASADLASSLGIWISDSEDEGQTDSLLSGLPSRLSAGWRLQVESFNVTDLTVMGCLMPGGMQRLASARRSSLAFDVLRQSDSSVGISGSVTGSSSFVVDDLAVQSAYLSDSVSRWLGDNGYLSGQWLRVDSARGRWRLDPGRARLESFQIVVNGPNVEFVSGELDLLEQTLLFRFTVQAHRPEGAIRIPGVEIKLRQPSLDVLIDGKWSAPRVELGGQPKGPEGSQDQVRQQGQASQPFAR